MRYLSWIVTVPLLVIAVIFAVNHRQTVEIDLWPLPMAIAPPIYLILLGAIFIGFLLGGLVVWWSQGRHRRRARRERQRADQTAHDLDAANRRLERVEAELKQARNGLAAGAPQALPRTGS